MSLDEILTQAQAEQPGQFDDLAEFWESLRDRLGLKRYRKRDNSLKKHCPHEDYTDTYVVLPAEWKGKHLQLRDEIVRAAQDTDWKDNPDFVQFAIALRIVDEFHIPSLEENPDQWDFSDVPIPVLSWIVDYVLTDFISSTYVPKVN